MLTPATVLGCALQEQAQRHACAARRADDAIGELLAMPAFARAWSQTAGELARLERDRDDAAWTAAYWRDVAPRWVTVEWHADMHGWRVELAVAEG